MIKRLMRCIGEYKKPAVVTPLFMVGEAVMECLMPFIIARLIDAVKDGCEMSLIVKNGVLLDLIF